MLVGLKKVKRQNQRYASKPGGAALLWFLLLFVFALSSAALLHMVVSTSSHNVQRDAVLNTQKSQRVRKALAAIAALAGGLMIQQYYATHYNKERKHDSALTGQEWADELLAGHRVRFYEQMGMNKHVFRWLVHELRTRTDLRDTRWVSAEEQVAIFLHLAVTGLPQRHLEERFQRSPDTLSKFVPETTPFKFLC